MKMLLTTHTGLLRNVYDYLPIAIVSLKLILVFLNPYNV